MRFFLLLSCFSCLCWGKISRTKEDDTIRSKAFDYLLSVRNEDYGWDDGQTPAIILGLLSANPTFLTGGKTDSDSVLAKKQLELEFLQAIARDPELTEMDSANLAIFAGALQASCFNLKNFHGINLMEKISRRLSSTPTSSPAFASLVLILCNNRAPVPIKLHQLNNNFKLGERCPFCVETTSLNIQALSCLEHASKETEVAKVKIINRLKTQNRLFIDSVQNRETGDFGTVVATSLAIQAYHLTWKSKSFDFQKAKKSLLSHVRDNGSFSNSALFTALSIPAISLNTGVTGGTDITCPNDNFNNGLVTVSYKITDKVYTHQSFRGSFKSKIGNSLYDALKEYSETHPDIFKLSVSRSVLGVQVSAINELKNDLRSRSFWRVSYVTKNDDKTVILAKGIDQIQIKDDVIYQFTYSII